MSKKPVILIIVILAILCIGILILFLPYFQSVPNAVIEVKKGTVETDRGSGWSKANSGTELKQGYQIRTGSDGEANIIFSGNSVARMENDSEVGITELKVVDKLLLVRLNQSKGDVWHSISPVSGIGSYIIETPLENFTEKGTSFGISIGKRKVAVLNGLVFHRGQEQVVLPMKMQAQILAGRPIRIAALEEDSWVQKNKKADEDWLIRRREEIKRKYSTQISIAKSLGSRILNTEITDEKINDGIDRYLRGEIDVPKLIEDGKVPEKMRPLIPDEFVRQPTNTQGESESVLDDLYRHVGTGGVQNSQYVPLKWKHAYEDGPDKSTYVPPDWVHVTYGTDKSSYSDHFIPPVTTKFEYARSYEIVVGDFESKPPVFLPPLPTPSIENFPLN